MNGEAEAVRQLLDRWILYRQESYFQRAFGLIPQRQSLLPDLSVQLHQGWGLLPSGDVSRLTVPVDCSWSGTHLGLRTVET